MKYISRIFVVVEAEGPGEACDAMSAAMSENLQCEGVILDWAYTIENGKYTAPRLISAEAEFLIGGDEDEPLTPVWEAATATQIEES